MGRYKDIDRSLRFVAIDPVAQILPGSFEHALEVLIDELSLSAFEARFKNEEVGAPAYSPAVLLKIVLLAYSKGIAQPPRHGGAVPAERLVHGDLWGQPAALHHLGQVHQQPARGNHRAVRASAGDLRSRRAHRA